MRLNCCVPFCKHTRGPRKGDKNPITADMTWICGRHWQATSKTWRRRLSLFERRKRYDLAARMWERLRQQAVDLAH